MTIPNYCIIDTAGQWTPIIKGDYSPSEMCAIGKCLLAKYPLAGQVAYINLASSSPKATMMGNELSINGTIAAAYYLQSPRLRTSGINDTLSSKYGKDTCTVTFPIKIIKNIGNKTIELSGIKYQQIPPTQSVSLLTASEYCGTDLAAGYIIEKNPGEIIPIVYVKATNTLITETACGSASLAYSLISGFEYIKQPSDSYIRVKINSDTLSVSTTVKKVNL